MPQKYTPDMPKRTHTDVAGDVPSEASAQLRRRLQESDARQLRSTERALAAREQRVADAERALAAREQQVADAERALAAREQGLSARELQVADAERALAAREDEPSAQAALERVRLWLPTLVKSDLDLRGNVAPCAKDTPRPAPETLAKFDTGASAGEAAAGNVAPCANDTPRPAPETLAKSDTGASAGNVAPCANDTPRPAPETLAKSDTGASGGGAAAVPGHEKTKNKITVNIKKPGTETICFIISKHRNLKKLMCRYCDIQGLDVCSTKFFLELESTDTSDGPRLVDGTVLHVLQPDTVAAKLGSVGALE